MNSTFLRLLLCLPLAVAAARAAPEFTQTNLYELGQEGYVSYRIPCIVITAHGTVLTFTSARRAVSDWANIDIMMRRSLDGGATWEPRKIIARHEKDTVDNPTAIADRHGHRAFSVPDQLRPAFLHEERGRRRDVFAAGRHHERDGALPRAVQLARDRARPGTCDPAGEWAPHRSGVDVDGDSRPSAVRGHRDS